MDRQPRRLPAPWLLERSEHCIYVRDASGVLVASVYFEDSTTRQQVSRLMSSRDAMAVARAIAMIPEMREEIRAKRRAPIPDEPARSIIPPPRSR